jgi:hypothetical protein
MVEDVAAARQELLKALEYDSDRAHAGVRLGT